MKREPYGRPRLRRQVYLLLHITRNLFEGSRFFLVTFFTFNIFAEVSLFGWNTIGFTSIIISTFIISYITPFTLSIIVILSKCAYSELLLLLSLSHWCALTVWTCFFFKDLHFAANWFFPLHLKYIFPSAGQNSLFGSYHDVHDLHTFSLLCVDVFSFVLTLILFTYPGLETRNCYEAVSNSLQMSMHLCKSSTSAYSLELGIYRTIWSPSINVTQLSQELHVFLNIRSALINVSIVFDSLFPSMEHEMLVRLILFPSSVFIHRSNFFIGSSLIFRCYKLKSIIHLQCLISECLKLLSRLVLAASLNA